MSFAKLTLIFVVLACAQSLQLTAQDCVIPFGSKRNWDTFWPVVFNEEGKLLDTSDDGETVIENGESVLISCGPNYLKKRAPKEVVTAKCQSDGKFQVADDLELKSAKDLACDLRSVQDILSPVVGCASTDTGVIFGLVHPINQKAYITGEACYSEEVGKTIFAHVRKGDLISAALDVHEKDVFKGRPPMSRYKLDFMKSFRLDEVNERLRSYLNSSLIPSFTMAHFVDNRFLLNRQLYSTKKLAWNYVVVHDTLSNYDLLKDDIKDLEGVVDIGTGSLGVSTWTSSSGERLPIYLKDHRFPVPEMIWVAVKRESDKTGYGFVVFNDPSLSERQIEEKSICQSNCENISWLKGLNKDKQWSRVEHGYVLCCNLLELEKATHRYLLNTKH